MADGTEPQKLKITFPNDSAFQKDLRARVDAYFVENKLEKGATPFMWAKTAFWLSLAAGSLLAAGLAPVSVPVAIGLWLLAGFGLAGVGFNVAHDAIHGATSPNKKINNLFSWSFDASLVIKKVVGAGDRVAMILVK